jgi:GNAT superfamily N-acetyltransferase
MPLQLTSLGGEMSLELTIRTANQNDLPSLLELYRQLHPNDETISPTVASNIFADFLRYSGSTIFLGLRDDRVVTTCTLIVVPNLTRGGAPYAFIENVVTDAQHRKRGYGKVILKTAISAAWRHDCYKVMLLTGSRDPATLSFYEEVGFEQSKTGFQARRIPPREA